MKSETQIAQENIYELIRTSKDKDLEATPLYWEGICIFHKETCQRFLEFLEEHEVDVGLGRGDETTVSVSPEYYVYKITDLKQAIKLYSENGI